MENEEKNGGIVFLPKATEDIVVSVVDVIKEINIKKEDLENITAYTILHKDNPDTEEILGSVHINLPFNLNQQYRDEIKSRNIPVEDPRLVCFGAFDASKDPIEKISLRCNLRNEHGVPISYINEELATKTEDISNKFISVIGKEIKEDLKEL